MPHAFETTDTSGDETEGNDPRRTVRSKSTYKLKKVSGADELSRFFVTGLTDASWKPSQFYCQTNRKDVSVKTHGMHEILRHYQGTNHLPKDQRLRMQTPGWRVPVFEGNPMRGRSWATAGANLEGSTSGEGERVSLLRRPHLVQVRCSWRQFSCACKCFGFDWSIAFGRELPTGPSALVSVLFGCWASECRRYVVAGGGDG